VNRVKILAVPFVAAAVLFVIASVWYRSEHSDDSGPGASSGPEVLLYVAAGLLAIGILLVAVFGLVRFVKWAGRDKTA
jgi:hypothetical protein